MAAASSPAADANNFRGEGDARRRWRSGAGSFAAGATAGLVSAAGLQPLEVIKTQMQGRTSRMSFSDAAIAIARTDGARGFWRGTGPSCVRLGLGAGLYFALLGPVAAAMGTRPSTMGTRPSTMETRPSAMETRPSTPSTMETRPSAMETRPSTPSSTTVASPSAATVGSPSATPPSMAHEALPVATTALAGATTRLSVAAVTCPITVVKTRMEWETGRYSSTASAVRAIAAREGVGGLYSGVWPMLARDAPYSGLYLVLYTRLRRRMRERFPAAPPTTVAFAAGAMAGGAATVMTHPPDVVRTRMQLDGGGSPRPRAGMWATAGGIVRTDGVRGLFVGAVPRMARRGLQQAFSWAIYEELAGRMNQI